MSKRRARHSRHRYSWLALLVSVGAIVLMAAALAFRGAPRARDAAYDSTAPGRLLAARSTVDLGRVPFDRLVEARYELTNSGGSVVRLVDRPRVAMLEGC